MNGRLRDIAQIAGVLAGAAPQVFLVPILAAVWYFAEPEQPGLNCSSLEWLVQEGGYCAAFPFVWDPSRPRTGPFPSHVSLLDCRAVLSLASNVGIPLSLLERAGDYMEENNSNALDFFRKTRHIDLCEYGKSRGWIGYAGDLSAITHGAPNPLYKFY